MTRNDSKSRPYESTSCAPPEPDHRIRSGTVFQDLERDYAVRFYAHDIRQRPSGVYDLYQARNTNSSGERFDLVTLHPARGPIMVSWDDNDE